MRLSSVWTKIRVVLDIGSVADIGVGSEFVALTQGPGEKVTLRITAAQGITRSVATVVSPAGAKVAAKDIFELAIWVPAERQSLYFWVPASKLTQAQIASAVSEARSSGVRMVNDPSLETWTCLISWDGTQWTLQKAGVRRHEPFRANADGRALAAQAGKGRGALAECATGCGHGQPAADEESTERGAKYRQ